MPGARKGPHTVTAVLLFGFAQPESLRLIEDLRARERTLEIIRPTVPDLPPERGRADAALVWAAGFGSAGPAHALQVCSDLSLPAVVLLPAYSIAGLDPARGIIDFAFAPFQSEEVLLRLRAALARAAGPGGTNVVAHGDLSMDLDRYEVTLAGRKIDLTYKEYELLKYLAMNPGRVFSREALLRSVWEYDYFGGTRTVDVHVRRLRSKIDDVKNGFIETVWNVGYRFRAPDG